MELRGRAPAQHSPLLSPQQHKRETNEQAKKQMEDLHWNIPRTEKGFGESKFTKTFNM